jgi:hypothetical protein
MTPEYWFPVFTLILGALLVIGEKWLETLWQRGQSAKDQERTTLIELQDALDDLMRRAWEAHAFRQRSEKVPAELSAKHRVASGRVRRLASRVGDEAVRKAADQVQSGAMQVITESYLNEPYPHTAESTLVGLDRELANANELIGKRIRKL